MVRKAIAAVVLYAAVSAASALETLEFAGCQVIIPDGYYASRHGTPDTIRNFRFEDDQHLFYFSYTRGDIDVLVVLGLKLLEENDQFRFYDIIFENTTWASYAFATTGEYLIVHGSDPRVLRQVQQCTNLDLDDVVFDGN